MYNYKTMCVHGIRSFLYHKSLLQDMVLDIHVTVHRNKFIVINQLDALISQIYFRNEILHYSGSSSVHHQKFFTVHTAMVYVIQFC
jgi:hypothetical protein